MTVPTPPRVGTDTISWLRPVWRDQWHSTRRKVTTLGLYTPPASW